MRRGEAASVEKRRQTFRSRCARSDRLVMHLKGRMQLQHAPRGPSIGAKERDGGPGCHIAGVGSRRGRRASQSETPMDRGLPIASARSISMSNPTARILVHPQPIRDPSPGEKSVSGPSWMLAATRGRPGVGTKPISVACWRLRSLVARLRSEPQAWDSIAVQHRSCPVLPEAIPIETAEVATATRR